MLVVLFRSAERADGDQYAVRADKGLLLRCFCVLVFYCTKFHCSRHYFSICSIDRRTGTVSASRFALAGQVVGQDLRQNALQRERQVRVPIRSCRGALITSWYRDDPLFQLPNQLLDRLVEIDDMLDKLHSTKR